MRRLQAAFLLLAFGSFLLAACTTSQGEVANALGGVCSGQGVAEAAAYTSGSGTHPIALINESGRRHEWNSRMPEGWYPTGVGEAQLVACIGDERERILEVCPYNGPDITRYVYDITIRLVEARTGDLVTTTTLSGDPPRECRASEPYDLTRLEGHIDYDQVLDWLRDYVEGTAVSTPSGGGAEPAGAPSGGGVEPASATLVDDFESGAGGWWTASDRPDSTIECRLDSGASYSGAASLRVGYTIAPNGWAVCGQDYDTSQDWSRSGGVSFWLRAEAADQPLAFTLYSGSGDSVRPFDVNFVTTPESVNQWVQFNFGWEEFARAGWAGPGGLEALDPTRITGYDFDVATGDELNEGAFWVDDMGLFRESGGGAGPAGVILVDDFEQATLPLQTASDEDGSSIECEMTNASARGGNASWHLSWDLVPNGWAYCLRWYEGAFQDWSSADGISFWYMAAPAGQSVAFWMHIGDPGTTYTVFFDTSQASTEDWVQLTFEWDDFELAPWQEEAPNAFDPAQLNSYGFTFFTEDDPAWLLLRIDDVSLVGE